ncbi:MAG: PHP domain-containing protein [Elusimicrobiota bacterium]
MEKQIIDLHLHTTYSDGAFSPEDLVRYAQETGILAIGITDHDTTDGIMPAIKEGAKCGVEIVPGVELSAELRSSTEGEMHILGYYINWENLAFQEQLKLFRQARERRAFHILDKLASLNIKIDEEKLFRISGIGAIGRLHIARAMLEQNLIDSIPEAFHKYLGFGKPAYVPKLRLKPQEAIKMVKKIGGIPVLAHPLYGNYANKNTIYSLVNAGLIGIEVYHSKHNTKVQEQFISLAREFGLLITGGSDCHGPFNDKEPLAGSIPVPYEVLENLKKQKQEIDRSNRIILKQSVSNV